MIFAPLQKDMTQDDGIHDFICNIPQIRKYHLEHKNQWLSDKRDPHGHMDSDQRASSFGLRVALSHNVLHVDGRM